jgi:hypothetical protein
VHSCSLSADAWGPNVLAYPRALSRQHGWDSKSTYKSKEFLHKVKNEDVRRLGSTTLWLHIFKHKGECERGQSIKQNQTIKRWIETMNQEWIVGDTPQNGTNCPQVHEVEFKAHGFLTSIKQRKLVWSNQSPMPPMDPTKPQEEACTADGRLKDAHEIEWVNDPDDATTTTCKSAVLIKKSFFSPWLGRSTPTQCSSTQMTLGSFGVVTQGQDAGSGSSNHVNKRPSRVWKPTTKVKEAQALTRAKKTSNLKGKQHVLISDDEASDQDMPRQWKRTRVTVEKDLDTDSNKVSHSEFSNSSKAHLFSRASEDAQDDRVNKKGSNDLDKLGDMSTAETNTTKKKEQGSEDEGWQFLELNEMATKDAQVRKSVWTHECFDSLENI